MFSAQRHRVVSVFALAWFLAQALDAQPFGSAFTYQGRLTDGGVPASGSYDLELKLFDALTDGNQVGGTLTRTVNASAGLFSVSLDFGGSAFSGGPRFLQIGVAPGGSGGPFSLLAPRQELTPAPHALYAADAATLGGIACGPNQIPKRNGAGSAWVCTADQDTNSGGTVTGVTAGAGLSGGTIMTSGTIAVADGGITSSM